MRAPQCQFGFDRAVVDDPPTSLNLAALDRRCGGFTSVRPEVRAPAFAPGEAESKRNWRSPAQPARAGRSDRSSDSAVEQSVSGSTRFKDPTWPNYVLVEAIIKLFGTQRLTVNVVFELINREPLITDYAFDKIAD